MRLLLCLCCAVLLGCSVEPNVEAINPEVKASAEQLSQILVTSKGVVEKQDTAIEILNVQTQSLTTVAESLLDVSGKVDALTALLEPKKPVSAILTSQDATVAEDVQTPELPKAEESDEVYIENWSRYSYCPSCNSQLSVLEEVNRDTGVLYWTYKADDPKYFADVRKNKITNVPVIRIVRRGKGRLQFVGLQTKDEILKAISKVRALDLSKDEPVTMSSDDLTIRNKLPVVSTRWGLIDLEEVNADGTCTCDRCIDLRNLKSEYLAKPEYQNIGQKITVEEF